MIESDAQLIERYASLGDESAFAELVDRHGALVYSAALRQTGGNVHLAGDVAQLVFTQLARKASSLSSKSLLAGWLHRATVLTVAQIKRTEGRRIMREAEAIENLQQEPEVLPWDRIAPVVDELLNKLRPADRDALLLRFFENRPLKEIAAASGCTESGISRRINRALEKLRIMLERRGVKCSTGALSNALVSTSIPALPAGLLAGLATGAVAHAAAAAPSAFAVWSTIAMSKIKIGAVSALLVAGVGTPLFLQQTSIARLKEENRKLQTGMLQDDLQRTPPPPGLAARELPNEQLLELMRLRAEVTALRRATNDLALFLPRPIDSVQVSIEPDNPPSDITEPGRPFKPNEYFPAAGWRNVGLDTHGNAVQSFLWAAHSGDIETYVAALNLTPAQRSQLPGRFGAEMLAASPLAGATGVKILAVGGTDSSPQVHYVCEFDFPDPNLKRKVHIHADNVGGSWRLKKNSSVEGSIGTQELP